MNQSLVPANAKKSMLILGMFRPTPDLIILISGVSITVFLLLIFGSSSFLLLIAACLPMLIALLLVMPVPYYHNTLCAIQSIMSYYTERKNFIWKGWCSKYEFSDKK